MHSVAGPSPVVLVVDDDPDMLRVIRSVLEDEGLTVTTAADGGQALASAAEQAPDLAVLDVGLPVLDGNRSPLGCGTCWEAPSSRGDHGGRPGRRQGAADAGLRRAAQAVRAERTGRGGLARARPPALPLIGCTEPSVDTLRTERSGILDRRHQAAVVSLGGVIQSHAIAPVPQSGRGSPAIDQLTFAVQLLVRALREARRIRSDRRRGSR